MDNAVGKKIPNYPLSHAHSKKCISLSKHIKIVTENMMNVTLLSLFSLSIYN